MSKNKKQNQSGYSDVVNDLYNRSLRHSPEPSWTHMTLTTIAVKIICANWRVIKAHTSLLDLPSNSFS